MFKGKTKAWATPADNNLNPVNNGENTKKCFFGKKDVTAHCTSCTNVQMYKCTSCTFLQTVDRIFIYQHDMKVLYHSAASA